MTTEGKTTARELIQEVHKLDPVEFVKFNEQLGQLVKRIGIADGSKGHRTSRVHFFGNVDTIKKIEDIIWTKCVAEITRDNSKDGLFGVENVVKTKCVNVMLPTKMYSYPLWFRYDGRDNTATMEIRDKDIWLLCKIDNCVLETLGKLDRKID